MTNHLYLHSILCIPYAAEYDFPLKDSSRLSLIRPLEFSPHLCRRYKRHREAKDLSSRSEQDKRAIFGSEHRAREADDSGSQSGEDEARETEKAKKRRRRTSE